MRGVLKHVEGFKLKTHYRGRIRKQHNGAKRERKGGMGKGRESTHAMLGSGNWGGMDMERRGMVGGGGSHG